MTQRRVQTFIGIANKKPEWAFKSENQVSGVILKHKFNTAYVTYASRTRTRTMTSVSRTRTIGLVNWSSRTRTTGLSSRTTTLGYSEEWLRPTC